MKKALILTCQFLILSTCQLLAQNVGVGTTVPNASAMLDIKASNKGLLIPRTSTASRTGIINPAKGLMVYDTTTSSFWYHSGSAWTEITGNGANKTLSNLTAPTAVNADLLPNAGPLHLGSPTKTWTNLYLGGAVYLGGFKFLANNNGTGNGNTALGITANASNTTGINNTATGYTALYFNTEGTNNTASGVNALENNITGNSNVANGMNSLNQNKTGNYNTASGYAALFNNVASNNTAIGRSALFANTGGYSNVAIGVSALQINTAGHNLVAVGDSALFHQTGVVGDFFSNTAIGSKALYSNTTGYFNVATGTHAAYSNNAGFDITAIGYRALYSNTTGNNNTASGTEALELNTTGHTNTATGSAALGSNTTGYANTADGASSLFKNTEGFYNTAVGYLAGLNVITGNNNTFLGYNANSGVAGILTNSTAIGSGATVTASNNFVFGNASVVKWGFGQAAAAGDIIDFVNTTARLTTGGVWTNASDRRLKDNFQQLDKNDILDKIVKLDIERWHYIKDGDANTTHIGPVAQDFYKAFRVGDDTTISTIDPGGVALLGIQQLAASEAAKDAEIKTLKKEAEELKQQLAIMERRLEGKEDALAKRLQQLETLVLQQNKRQAEIAKK